MQRDPQIARGEVTVRALWAAAVVSVLAALAIVWVASSQFRGW